VFVNVDSIKYRLARDFSLLHNVQTGSGAHPAYYTMGTGGKADHSPPSGVEVKNDGAIPPFPHISSWRVVLN
jgi:hypothetical protein